MAQRGFEVEFMMFSPARVLGALPIAALVLGLGACFEIEEPVPDAGPIGSALNGRILVVGAQVSTTRPEVERGVLRSRTAVHRLAEGNAVLAGDLGQDPGEASSLKPIARAPSKRGVLGQSKGLEWRPGEAIVTFKKARYTSKDEVREVVAQIVARSRSEARVDVHLCSGAQWFCLLKLYEPDGKPLDLGKTERVVADLHTARGSDAVVVARNFIKRAFRVPNDPNYIYQWHYDFAKLPAAWDISVGSPNLIVAVVDSGIKTNHPDTGPRSGGGFDFIEDPGIGGDENGRDPDPTDPGDNAYGNGQSSWHGTHVAGTIGAETDNAIGVAGVLWQGQVMPIRVLGMGAQGSDYDILSGIIWSVGDSIEGVPDNTVRAKVLNLSLGGPTDQQGEQVWNEIVGDLINNGEPYGHPLIVAAVGNSNENGATTVPANIPGIISVGAARFDGRRAEYSNWGDVVSIMAPGGQASVDQNVDGFPDGVLSLFDNDYNFEQGTSMAAPHVSGIVGLLSTVKENLTQAEALQILRDTANPAGVCTEGCGAGHVDAAAAMLAAGGAVQQTPLLAVDVTRLIYQPSVTSLDIGIFNLGEADMPWTSEVVGAQAALWSMNPSSGIVPAGSAIPATVFLNRGEFAAGSANLQVIGQGEAANQLVRVDLSFNDDAQPVQTDLQAVQVVAFRLLDDQGNLAPEGEPAIARRDASFAWRIEGIPPGTYFVFAIGDDNNDGIFDAQRESFGAWPVASDPVPIEVPENANVTNVEFGVTGGFVVEGQGGVGAPCGNNLDCVFAADSECITDWPGGYCSRTCDDGFCGASASCEILECAGGACNVCLASCVSETQCRSGSGYICDPYGTCTPQGF
jgi:serine protease